MDNITAALAADIVESYGPAVQANLRTKDFFFKRSCSVFIFQVKNVISLVLAFFGPFFAILVPQLFLVKNLQRGVGGEGVLQNNLGKSHSQMLGKVEYGLPEKI